MGNFTPEQALKEADWAVSCERYAAATMLRAYAATLRQQAGMVDEGVIDALRTIADWNLPETGETWPSGGPVSYEAQYGSNGARDYMRKVARAALTAARAQNTQGEALGFQTRVALEVGADEADQEDIIKHLAEWMKVARHAERARVPDGRVLVPREPTPEMAASFGYMATRGFHACYESMLSAAPSQRAEVK